MDRLRELGRNVDVEDEIQVIESSALELSRAGGFNFLMSDGERLYAFWSGCNKLHYTLRAPPLEKRITKMMDEDFEVNLGEFKGTNEVATIVATRQLTNEPWMLFPLRKLLVFDNGLLKLKELEWKMLELVRRSPNRVNLREIAK